MTTRLYISIFSLLLSPFCTHAQTPLRLPHESIKTISNPAVQAFSQKAEISYLNQWYGISGAPKFLSMSIGSSLNEGKVGVGFILTNQNYSFFEHSSFGATYGYKVKLKPESYLLLGLELGIQHKSVYGISELDKMIDPAVSKFVYQLPKNQGYVGCGFELNFKNLKLGSSGKFVSLNRDLAKQQLFIFSNVEYDHTLKSGNFKIVPYLGHRVYSVTDNNIDIGANLVHKRFGIGFGQLLKNSTYGKLDIVLSERIKTSYSYYHNGINNNFTLSNTHFFSITVKLHVNNDSIYRAEVNTDSLLFLKFVNDSLNNRMAITKKKEGLDSLTQLNERKELKLGYYILRLKVQKYDSALHYLKKFKESSPDIYESADLLWVEDYSIWLIYLKRFSTFEEAKEYLKFRKLDYPDHDKLHILPIE